MDFFDLSGRVAIITGGNGGLGLGIAKGLAREGCAVALVGRKQEKIDRAVKEMTDEGFQAIGVQADVSREEDVNRMVRETVEQLGRVDILFNNAAISWGIHPDKMTLDEWNNFIAIDLTSCFLCCKAVYPEMVKAGGGKIVNVGSAITNNKGFGKLVHYAAAKGGMDHMTQSLAQAWGKDNIQVNALLPGLVHSEMMPCFGPNKIRPVDYIVKRSPVGRFAMPEDFEGVSVLLASRASDFITGSIIVADGGMTLAL